MKCAFVIPGKYGDCLSILPILNHNRKSGRVPVVTSKRYADIFDGFDWIEVHSLDHDWQNLEHFIRYAKSKFEKVIVLSVFGKSIPFEHRLHSFQLDQYSRAGMLERWDDWNVEIPRPPNSDELVARYIHGTPTILLADSSESSPFEYSSELHAMLTHEFPDHQILCLSEIRLTNLKDFLPIYDAADLIVTTETSHLHLSKFTNTPVIALTTDTPSHWNGSAYSNRFAMQMRYSDWPFLKNALIYKANNILFGIGSNLVPDKINTPKPFSYNPSIIRHEGRLLTSYRHHEDSRKWRTQLRMLDGENDYPIFLHDSLGTEHSFEDMRLFRYKDQLHGSYVVSRYGDNPSPFTPCAVGYGRMEFRDGTWHVVEHIQPKYGKNNFSGQEKNWLLFEHEDHLYCSYQCVPEHIVIQLDGDRVVKEFRNKCDGWKWGAIRGGTQPIPYEGKLLRFFHSQTNNLKKFDWWNYHMGAMLMDNKPPFEILKISSSPILSGTNQYCYGWKNWKPRVVIPYGAIEVEGSFRVSIGLNDSECAIVDLKESDLKF